MIEKINKKQCMGKIFTQDQKGGFDYMAIS